MNDLVCSRQVPLDMFQVLFWKDRLPQAREARSSGGGSAPQTAQSGYTITVDGAGQCQYGAMAT
jgi:hypothetical protein